MRVRVTERSLAAARQKADGAAEKIRQATEFLQDFDRKFWEGVTIRLRQRISDLEAAREAGWRTLPEAELRAFTAVEKELKSVISLPARAQKELEDLRKGHQEILGKINERVSRQG